MASGQFKALSILYLKII